MSENSADRHCAIALQDHILARPRDLPKTAKALFKQLKNTLVQATNNDRLCNSHNEICRLLRREPPNHRSTDRAVYELLGGPRDFKRRLPSDAMFARPDGACFNFSITVAEHKRENTLNLLAYNFEIRFPDNAFGSTHGPRFVRFDLNLPEHNNETKGLRCHLHPGHDDLQAPSALMTPIEILDLCIYGLAIPQKPRAA